MLIRCPVWPMSWLGHVLTKLVPHCQVLYRACSSLCQATLKWDLHVLLQDSLVQSADLQHLGEHSPASLYRSLLVRSIDEDASAGLNAEYVNQVMDGFELEAVCKARRTGDYHIQTGPTSKPQAQLATALMVYRAVLRPWVRKLLALLLACLSAVVVWSEATIGSGRRPDLSPFSLVQFDPLLRPFSLNVDWPERHASWYTYSYSVSPMAFCLSHALGISGHTCRGQKASSLARSSVGQADHILVRNFILLP